MIDTHTHIDGEEFAEDLQEVIVRAKEAGMERIFVPAINLEGMDRILSICRNNPGYAFPMIGLHPEEVKADYNEVLDRMEAMLDESEKNPSKNSFIAIGEIGLDFYWSREFEKEQLLAFERQVQWAVKYQLPLNIHCRKGQNEMVAILQRYEKDLPGGVFHCFTGNSQEAAQLLRFSRFSLGIGGVLTFKKSNLPDVVKNIPLDRIVLETDAPYMAPVPMRGKRNESSYVPFIAEKLAECLSTTVEHIDKETTANALRIYPRAKHYNVVCAIISRPASHPDNESGATQYLCFQRTRSRYAYTSEKWEFAGGKIEQGETPQEALQRELREELSWNIKANDIIGTIVHHYPHFSITLTAINCTADSFDYCLREHLDDRWCTMEEMQTMPLTEADRRLLGLL